MSLIEMYARSNHCLLSLHFFLPYKLKISIVLLLFTEINNWFTGYFVTSLALLLTLSESHTLLEDVIFIDFYS